MAEGMEGLTRLIARQAKDIKHLQETLVRIENNNKRSRNRDRYTFNQAAILKCNEKGFMPYLKDVIGHTPNWEDMTMINMQKFVDYLTYAKSKRLKSKNLLPNTQNLYISNLRKLVDWGNMKSDDVRLVLKQKRIPQRRKVWLHPDELERIYKYRFLNREASTWRTFMLCALVGCRVSDAATISVSNLDGNTLRYTPIKTRNTECYIKLNGDQIKMFKFILSIDNYGIEPSNKMLREICKRAHLSRKFDIGMGTLNQVEPIYEHIHFHTARYSFATIKYRYSDLTDREIAIALGHTSFNQTWNSYICDKSPITDEDKQVKGLFI